MPSLVGTDIAANYKKHVISQSGVGKELIVSILGDDGNGNAAAMVDADLDAMIAYITTQHGSGGTGDSAFTIGGLGTANGSAFVSGATTKVFLRCQGTGDHDAAWVAAVKAAGDAVGNIVFNVAVEAVFTPAR